MSGDSSNAVDWHGSEDSPEGDDTIEVETIVPNLPVEGAVKRVSPEEGVTANDVRVIGYPRFLFDYEITLARAFLSDRQVDLSVTVDGITGGKHRNDAYPELETRDLAANACLTPRFEREEARERSRSVIRRYISFHFPTSVMVRGMPETNIVTEDLALGLYWLVPHRPRRDAKLSVVDSITGEVQARDVEPGDVTAETLSE